MPVERIDLNPDKDYTFSSCVIAGDYIYTAHQGGALDEKGNFLKSLEEQTEQCFRNLRRTLEAAGATLSDVVKTTVLLQNAEDFRKMDDIYRRHFAEGYPARTTVVTKFVSSGILIQIDAVAYKPR